MPFNLEKFGYLILSISSAPTLINSNSSPNNLNVIASSSKNPLNTRGILLTVVITLILPALEIE